MGTLFLVFLLGLFIGALCMAWVWAVTANPDYYGQYGPCTRTHVTLRQQRTVVSSLTCTTPLGN